MSERTEKFVFYNNETNKETEINLLIVEDDVIEFSHYQIDVHWGPWDVTKVTAVYKPRNKVAE